MARDRVFREEALRFYRLYLLADPTPSAMDSRARLPGRSHRTKNRTEVHMPGWGAAIKANMHMRES